MAELTGSARTLLSGKTAWARNLETPLRLFLRDPDRFGRRDARPRATVAALVWANVEAARTRASGERPGRSGSAACGIVEGLRSWVNSGLMTLFFFVVGLEARREFDLGDLRDRRRLLLPMRQGSAGCYSWSPSTWRSTARARTAGGARRCRPIPRLRWGCWRSSAGAFRQPARVHPHRRGRRRPRRAAGDRDRLHRPPSTWCRCRRARRVRA